MIRGNIYTDELTGLQNFISFFRADFKDVFDSHGFIVYFRVKPINHLNTKYGRGRADKLIEFVGKYILNNISQDSFRHEGTGFIVVYKKEGSEKVKKDSEALIGAFNNECKKLQMEEGRLVNFLMQYDEPILSVADYYRLFHNVYMNEFGFENDRDLLHSIIASLSYRVNEMIEENFKSREFALIDEVSRIPNSKSATFYLNELQDAKNEFAILFIDGDNLREFNKQSYEHGNEAIRQIADIIQSSIRKSDKVFRWLSGDEFLVIAEDIELDKIKELAERIRRNVEIGFKGEDLTATISIGISRYPHDSSNLKLILNYAEIANKEAKNKGKNRFVFFTETLAKDIEAIY